MRSYIEAVAGLFPYEDLSPLLTARMHIPATGRPIEIRGVSLLTVRGGQITHGLYIWDVAGLLRSIGLLPEL